MYVCTVGQNESERWGAGAGADVGALVLSGLVL